jgi:hypothetical protein
VTSSFLRTAALLSASALVAGCAKPGPSTAPGPASVQRALVIKIGQPGAPVLDDAQQAEVNKAVTGAPPDIMKRLRYALAPDETGKVRLVVYDGQGLPADGKRPGKKFDYIVFHLLNVADGSTYDPQQNAIQAPVPPAKERGEAAADTTPTTTPTTGK